MSLSRRQFVASTAALTAAASLPRVAYTAAAGEIDVIVIGAGLSGLETAVTLEENGLRVLVLEGRQRIGGRMLTLYDVPGNPEAGGNSIANAYGRSIAAGTKYDIEVVNMAPRLFGTPLGQELYVGGEHIPLKDWPTHPRNPFAGDLKKLAPWAWGDAMFKQHMPFEDLQNWYSPKYAEYDVSVHSFLASKGATEAMLRLGYDINIAYGTTSQDVSLLTQAFADYWINTNRGALMAFSRTGAQNVPPSGSVPSGLLIGAYKGGNQNLPIAMAKRLKGDLLQGKRVAAIDLTDTGVTVRCADGTRYRARGVVSSMPFSTLRHVAIDPLPQGAQQRAIQTLGYIPITQFHLVPSKPFWEVDGLSPSMWTDGPLGMVLAQRFGATDTEITSLTVWCRGANGNFIDRFGLEAGGRMIIAEYEKLRPAAKGLLRVGGAHSWSMDPFSAGDWAIFQPGQVRDFQAEMARPHGRMYFCGEHTSVGSRGIEGAFESAERVSLEVLNALA